MSLNCKKCQSSDLKLVREVLSRTSYPINEENVVSEEDNDYWDTEKEVVECVKCEARHYPVFDEDDENKIVNIRLWEE